MYFLLGTSLVFAFLLTLNVCASISASVVWRTISARAEQLSARRQEQIIFALRVFPVGAAVLFVLALLLPAYVLYEPEKSGEVVSLKLAVISLLSILGICLAAFRVLRTWLSTRTLLNKWLKLSDRIEVDGVNIPVFRLRHPFPVIAVVGTFRPRMFVASQIFESLTPEELRAAIAHEYGHLAAHDNFKRTFLRVCRDLLVIPVGRRLDRAWADNIESAADEYAASVGGKTMALDLAATLIKIARIAPENASPGMPLGSFILEKHSGDIKRRIRRLVELSDQPNISTLSIPKGTSPFAIILFAGIVTCVAVLIYCTGLLVSVHEISEKVVAVLQ